MKKLIEIKKSEKADTRTCDVLTVSKKELLDNSKQHIADVGVGLNFLINILQKKAKTHDWTKIEYIDEFYKDFKNNFKTTNWWILHQKKERHHFNTEKYIQEDINLLDVIEQIVDGVMAGLARSGKYRYEPISNELLQKAYKNTAKLLIDNIKVVD